MKKEIRYRLNGLESMIHRLHHNRELLEYFSHVLHRRPFNLFNNTSLYWIWGQAMGDQIITFYKVMVKDEKFSFMKIINVARELKCNVNYDLLENETKAVKAKYDKTDFEIVRSKYVAHQDLGVLGTRTDLRTISSLTEKTIQLFFLLSKEFKGRKVNFSNGIVDSLFKIFDAIDEYGEVQAYIIAERIKGNSTVTISKITKVARGHQREARKRVREIKRRLKPAPADSGSAADGTRPVYEK